MLRRSPIDAIHRDLGAKMGAFGGWDMPISYPAGTLAEHAAVRTSVGLFDVSHLGKIRISGSAALALLDRELANRMSDLGVGRARYSLLLNQDGGILDDLIAYVIDEGDVLVVPNASNRDAVAERLVVSEPEVTGEVVDLTTFAIQGPDSRQIVESLFPESAGMGYMSVVQSGSTLIARSGYTGEWGYEVFTEGQDAEGAWGKLAEAVGSAGGEICGLAARDTLRLEMGYPLHGNDLSEDIDPMEAGLSWAVKLEGRDFPGADALRSRESSRQAVGLIGDHRVIPRAGCDVLLDGEIVGTVTSGTLSPTLRQPIALALVAASAAGAEQLQVDVRGRSGTFSVVEPPFVDRSPRKA